jgi:hypothetical protein
MTCTELLPVMESSMQSGQDEYLFTVFPAYEFHARVLLPFEYTLPPGLLTQFTTKNPLL